MHDGSIRTLLDVLRFYNQGGVKNPMLDDKMVPLNLSEHEMNAIVEFLRALTGDDTLRLVQSSKPQTRTPVPFPDFPVWTTTRKVVFMPQRSTKS